MCLREANDGIHDRIAGYGFRDHTGQWSAGAVVDDEYANDEAAADDDSASSAREPASQ